MCFNFRFTFVKIIALKQVAILLMLTAILGSCVQTGVFEKTITLQKHEWPTSQKPVIRFNITDTNVNYRVFFVIRHTNAYRYNNLWIKVLSKGPGDSLQQKQQFDLPLATNNKWNGTGMDDIFDQRILLSQRPLTVIKPGIYEFTIQHIMREDPLQEILNVGIRLEKTTLP
ncbi:MAG: gliding motility lipoprotein GldH [Chitinophagaceae bacterium]